MDQNFVELLETGGLYQPLKIDNNDFVRLIDELQKESWSIQLFCPVCKENFTFLNSNRIVVINVRENEYNIQLGCTCTKDHSTDALFFLKYINGIFFKVGQYPSPIDTDRRIPNQYAKYLSEPYYKYYRNSLALHQESYHIGAYVYLRRILENLIEQASKRAISEGILGEDDYLKLRVSERIKKLEKYLPVFMVENRGILYGLLSLGIHALDEETCQDAYLVLKQSIDYILDDIIASKRRELAMKDTSAALGKLKARLYIVDDIE